MGVECPVCGEYEGEPEAVEAHISSRVDSEHKGKVGRHYHDQLYPDGDSGGDEADEDGESAGIPVPVNSWVIVAGGVAFFLWALSSGRSREGEGVEETAETPVDSGLVGEEVGV